MNNSSEFTKYTQALSLKRNAEKRLAHVNELMNSAGMEWFPKENDFEDLEREKETIINSLKFYNGIINEYEEKNIDEEMIL